jgi:microsomal dipeptidase-like Zn-dependent dipeptidase
MILNTPLKPEWQQLHEQATVVDLHAHPIFKALLFRRSLSRPVKVPDFLAGELNPLTVQTAFPKLQTGGVDVLFSTAYPLEKRIFEDIRLMNLIPLRWIHKLPISLIQDVWSQVVEPPYFTVANTMLDSMEEQVRLYNRDRTPSEREACIAHSGIELRQGLDQPHKPIMLVHSLEGGHSLEGELGLHYIDQPWHQLSAAQQAELKTEVLNNLDALFKRGVAYLVLAHFYPNKLVMPVFPYPEHLALSLIPHDNLRNIWFDVTLTEGLTELGRAVVQKMIEIGMLIDVSHATPKARQEIYGLVEASGRTHPIVMATHVGAYAINPSPYNLEDWEIKWIAEHGGVIGVIFMTYWLAPAETKFGINLISRTIEHIVNVGGEDVVGIGTDFDGADPPDDIEDSSEIGRITERLFSEYTLLNKRRYSDRQIEKVLGKNALRVLFEGWGQP